MLKKKTLASELLDLEVGISATKCKTAEAKRGRAIFPWVLPAAFQENKGT